MTIVGAVSGRGPIMRYSRRAPSMSRKPSSANGIGCSIFAVIPGRPGGPNPEPITTNLPDELRRSCAFGTVGVYGFRALAFGEPRNDSLSSRPQLEPLDLPRRRLRQAVDDLDPARIFPRADGALDVLLQRLAEAVGAPGGVLQHDIGFRLEKPLGVHGRHDRGLEHGVVADQRRH